MCGARPLPATKQPSNTKSAFFSGFPVSGPLSCFIASLFLALIFLVTSVILLSLCFPCCWAERVGGVCQLLLDSGQKQGGNVCPVPVGCPKGLMPTFRRSSARASCPFRRGGKRCYKCAMRTSLVLPRWTPVWLSVLVGERQRPVSLLAGRTVSLLRTDKVSRTGGTGGVAAPVN